MIITPEKHLSPKYCVLNITGDIISLLLKKGKVGYSELFDYIIGKHGKNITYESVIQSLSFLYLLGKVEFNNDLDCFSIVVGS